MNGDTDTQWIEVTEEDVAYFRKKLFSALRVPDEVEAEAEDELITNPKR